jgi:cytochrome c553
VKLLPFPRLFALLAALWALAAAQAASPVPAEGTAAAVAQGRAIYVEGRLPDGRPLQAQRMGLAAQGAAVACVNCHRRSGMGSVEGDQLIAPISGRALFLSKGQVVATMDPTRGKLMNQGHEPYTEAEVARAVREGRHPTGRDMNELMPRYALSEAEMAALNAYLRTLSAAWSPGVDEHRIQLATVITPDVDPARRKLFLDTLQAAVSQKNGNTMPGKRHMVTAAEFTMKTERHWDLQVWDLQGAPETWRAQLQARYDAAPVFAVVSGLSGSTWAPVHQFCEQQQVPCWFPSVAAVPAEAEQGHYTLYFSRGVALEAAVLARHLLQLPKAAQPRRLVQLLDSGPAAAAAAAALQKALAGSPIKLEARVLKDGVAPDTALAGLRKDDALVLWLAPEALQALQAQAPPAVPVYLSSALAQADRLPQAAAWKPVVHLVYPYELPQRRGSNLAYFRSWINQRRVPLLDEPMQSEVYFAAIYLSETVGEMLNNLYGDYLIERAENMLSRRESRKAEEETRERQTIRQRFTHVIEQGNTGGNAADAQRDPQRALITAAENLGRRTGTTAYPPLGLGPGQHFASKGAYIAKYAEGSDKALVAESAWIVP